jgi:hypothetical protein
MRNICVIVQTQDDSGHFEEVKEEPKNDEKGKGEEKENVMLRELAWKVEDNSNNSN